MWCWYSSRTQTSAQPKRRPALVVQADNLNTGLKQIIVAVITSNMSRADYPSRVTLLLNSSEGKQAHILTDSIVMTENLATIRENEIDRVLALPEQLYG
jgi:mRNA interferase MazF